MKRNVSIGSGFGEFWIEPDVAALLAVEELTIEQDICIRKYGPQRLRLTPAGCAMIRSGTNPDDAKDDNA